MVYKIDHERYKSYKFSISIEIMEQTESYQKISNYLSVLETRQLRFIFSVFKSKRANKQDTCLASSS